MKYNDSIYLNYLDSIAVYPLLKEEEEKELVKKMQGGSKEARKALVTSNLRLVVSVANECYKKFNGLTTLDLMDLIQYGNIGLMKALDNYDSSYEVKVATHAVYRIRETIIQNIYDNELNKHVPNKVGKQASRAVMLEYEMLAEKGIRPTDEEIAARLNVPIKYYKDCIKKAIYVPNCCSIDNMGLSPEGEEFSYLDKYFTSSESVEDEVDRAMLLGVIQDILQKFSERERLIIYYRFGFIEGKTHSLDEIGKKLDLTRERVRQIEKKVLEKLKSPKYLKYLSGYDESYRRGK